MEEKKPSRRKPRRAKPENYYQILGVRADAEQAVIKQKYTELVKAFPPETHPAEFQQIRRAYETLRDPAKRREYDLQRKYGGRVEKIMDETMKLVEAGKWNKAEELCRQAATMLPDNVGIRLVLANILLAQGDMGGFEQEFAVAGNLVPEKDKIHLVGVKARFLLDNDLAEAALQVLDHARALMPDQVSRLTAIYTEVYLELGMTQEAWALAESTLPAPQTENPEDIFAFIHYIYVMIELEQWSKWSGVQQRLRRFLKSIRDEEDRLMVQTALIDEHDWYYRAGRFREAEMFIDLAYYADPKNPYVQRQRPKTQELMRVEKELKRAARDENLFPLVYITAFEWFYQDFWDAEMLNYLRDGLPRELLEQLEEVDEEFAAGIVLLRKKYPLLYRRFQSSWDALFKEKTAYLNREARRRLR
ncbi:MAG: DnaJ domain-containing protein [Bacillota bacterium]